MTIRNAASKCICSCKEISLTYAAAPCSLIIELLSNALRPSSVGEIAGNEIKGTSFENRFRALSDA